MQACSNYIPLVHAVPGFVLIRRAVCSFYVATKMRKLLSLRTKHLEKTREKYLVIGAANGYIVVVVFFFEIRAMCLSVSAGVLHPPVPTFPNSFFFLESTMVPL